MKPSTPTEHEEQVALVDWWSWNCYRWRLPVYALFAIPNGGGRGKADAGRLKAEGVRPGILDLMLAVTRPNFDSKPFPGLFIEMKRKPNTPSKEQVEVMLYLRQQGYHCVVAWNFDEGKRAIEAYLGAPA